MKCEICNKADAEVAIVREKSGEEEELYVCKACAALERKRNFKKSSRTRKVTGLPPGVSMSVTQIGGDGEAPPPIVEAIMNAFSGFVDTLGGSVTPRQGEEKNGREAQEFPLERVEHRFRMRGKMHLEALHLIGELDAVKRAMRALRLELCGVSADGVDDAGHVYAVKYTGGAERVKRVIEDVLAQERNARVRLFEELPRVFGDALCRALAILKNCRLLAPGELFDLLSPLRLAAAEGLLDGITLEEIERMMAEVDLGSDEDKMAVGERDLIDAERADEMNRRFEDVVLNERAEGKIL